MARPSPRPLKTRAALEAELCLRAPEWIRIADGMRTNNIDLEFAMPTKFKGTPNPLLGDVVTYLRLRGIKVTVAYRDEDAAA